VFTVTGIAQDGCELDHTGWHILRVDPDNALSDALCAEDHGRPRRARRCWRHAQEVAMTLTVLDPRSGQKVTLWFEDVPAVRQPVPATVSTHPRFAARPSKETVVRSEEP
jgi:hypothetical protein